jgi:putative SOS response-associated peptidase YedK
MCYSAMVEQNLKSIGLKWKARIHTSMFEDLFRRRLQDDRIHVAKALEENFLDPHTPQEQRIHDCIVEHRKRRAAEYETALFQQKKRLADAERSLSTRETRKALEIKRIAANKIDWNRRKLTELRRAVPEPGDSRIFPFWYAPVCVWEDGGIVVTPMRYHCRPNGRPESLDRRYGGLYNARRDSLERFWKNLYGRHHAFFLVSSFYENVALHDYQKRKLRPGEKETNLVLHFNPNPPATMIVACLWDCWQSPGQPDLHSFAAITDDPPPEVAATGHNRCVIPLRENNVETWLRPETADKARLSHILDNRERPTYEHELAA